MTHEEKLTNRRLYESERALAYEAWQQAALANVKDVKTDEDVLHIDDAAKLIAEFEKEHNTTWEDVLKQMAQRLREGRR